MRGRRYRFLAPRHHRLQVFEDKESVAMASKDLHCKLALAVEAPDADFAEKNFRARLKRVDSLIEMFVSQFTECTGAIFEDDFVAHLR